LDEIRYTVDARDVRLNTFRVTMEIGREAENVEIAFPAWTPGSYVIRDFAGNVSDVFAERKGRRFDIKKKDKSTWEIGRTPATVNYTVHAHRHSVQDSYVDDEHLTINGASAFAYAKGVESLPHVVTIVPHEGWSRVSSSLKSLDTWKLYAENYDILVDSPIEVGNHEVHKFTVKGKEHELALFGRGNIDVNKFLRDLKKIVQSEISIMGEAPYERYVFIYHLIPKGSGGLEHLSSTHCISDPFLFRKREDYLSVLELFSHEFFHLWNVKRLRPKPLGPFDYSKENYTEMLWFSEGFTSYYELLAIRKALISSPSEFLRALCREIEIYKNTPGRLHQSASESSFDTWIKFYKGGENARNSTISYYNKGALLAMLLDLLLIKSTDGKKRLQHVMRHLYTQTYRRGRWFDEPDFIDAFSRVADIDISSFYSNYMKKPGELPLEDYLGYAGLRLDREISRDACLYIMMSADNPLTIAAVLEGGPAADAGLYPRDEIIAVNGTRIKDDLKDRIAELSVGSKVEITVARDGRLRRVELIPKMRPPKIYLKQKKEASGRQRKVYENWCYARWDVPIDYSALRDPENYQKRYEII
jgi:predicted metalloprotease with PDZ domain